jgi:hypothetical protein
MAALIGAEAGLLWMVALLLTLAGGLSAAVLAATRRR